MTRFWDQMLGRSGPYATLAPGVKTAALSAQAAVKGSRTVKTDADANVFNPVALVSKYNLNGNAVDSDGGIDGTVVGSWTSTQGSLVNGDPSQSMYKDGSTAAHITLPAGSHNFTDITVSFYYEPNADPGGTQETLLVCGDGTQPGDLAIERWTNGLLRAFHVRQDGTFEWFVGANGITGTDLLKGVAHRFGISLGALGAKLYRDGTVVATLPSHTNSWNSAALKRLGTWADGTSNRVIGAMDLVRIWRGQKLDTEMAALEAPVSVTLPPISSPPGPVSLEPFNPSATQVTMTVGNVAQQRWDGFGFGMGTPGDAGSSSFGGKRMYELAAQWPALLFSELSTKWLHGYSPSNLYQGMANLGVAQGVTGIIQTGGIYNQTSVNGAPGTGGVTVCNALADGMVSSGVNWTHVEIQNEPDGGNSSSQFVGMTSNDFTRPVQDNQSLRNRLNAIGGRWAGVKIISMGWAHYGGRVDTEYTAYLNAGYLNPTNPMILAGNGHAYQDCPTESNWDSHWASRKPQGMFQTECGYGSTYHTPARMLTCLNVGCGVWIHHGGQAITANQDNLDQTLVYVDGTRRPWHASLHLITQGLGGYNLGALFRVVRCSDRPTGQGFSTLNVAQADRMVRFGTAQSGPNPRLNSAVAKRPDGKWCIAVTNATSGAGVYNSFLGNAYPAALFQCTFNVPELAGFTGNFTGQRASKAGVLGPAETTGMVNGTLRCTVNESETLVLVG